MCCVPYRVLAVAECDELVQNAGERVPAPSRGPGEISHPAPFTGTTNITRGNGGWRLPVWVVLCKFLNFSSTTLLLCSLRI